MRKDNPAPGFSFLIADTPTPSRDLAGERGEQATGGFELDFSDVSPPGGRPSPAATRPRVPTLLDSAPPPEVTGPGAPARPDSEDLSPASWLDASPSPKVPADFRPERPEPPASENPPSSTPLKVHRALLREKFRQVASARKDPVPGHQAQFAHPSSSPAAPEVKKIAFPTRQKSPALSPQPRTRFAQGGFRVQVAPEEAPRHAVSRESEDIDSILPADLSRGPSRRSPGSEPEEDHPGLAPPEDFPHAGELSPEPTWSNDTPTAKELWLQARSGLFQAGQLAKAAGRKGLTKSRSVATVMSAALRHRLAQSAADLETAPGAGARPDRSPLSSDPEGAAALAGAVPASSAQGGVPASSRSPSASPSVSATPSATSRVRRRPSLTERAARSLAAPLAACAAAALVYQAGSHFLGSAAQLSLSKSAPAVPDLGQLGTPDGARGPADPSPGLAPGGSPTKPGGAPPMQSELAPMPEGMSWPGKGLIEVVTAEDELIYVDGVFTGRGPLRRIPVAPGEHEVSIKQNGSERQGTVSVELDRCTRAVFTKAP